MSEEKMVWDESYDHFEKGTISPEQMAEHVSQQIGATVNLEEFDSNGFEKLRPISIAFESPKFMLPIRLGMMNAQGDQDLLVYLLSPKGQVQLTNYRTVKVPSNTEIPEFVQTEFKDFYTAMFQKSYEKENKEVAFLEYAWDMSTCDPCSAEPLNQEELKQAGVFWLDRQNYSNRWGGNTLGNSSMRETKTALPRNIVILYVFFDSGA